MATLDTTDDLLRAARENREFRETFRREILTEELLAVPNDLTELKAVTANIAATGEALLEHADVTNQRLENMVDGITALVQGMADYKTATENRLVEVSGNFAEVKTSIVRVENMRQASEEDICWHVCRRSRIGCRFDRDNAHPEKDAERVECNS